MSKANGKQLELFKISSVSDLTGLSPTILRAWERRYRFLEPERLPGGHRMYTRDDLRVLMRVKELLQSGHSVGELAGHGRSWLLGLEEATTSDQRWVEQAENLVAEQLKSFRVDRYRGEGLSVSLRLLDTRDLACVSLLYDRVSTVYELWRYMDPEARDKPLLWKQIEGMFDGELRPRLARLGSYTKSADPLLRAALEDAKFGAVEPLVRLLGDSLQKNDDNLRRAVLLCRDQAKMLRNAFYDLDDSLRSADEANKVHGIRSLLSKLEELPLNLEVYTEFEGALSSRCLETSAVDRVLYGLLRKMANLGVGDVKLWIGEVGNGLLRLAFHHPVTDCLDLADDELPALAAGMAVGVSGEAALRQGFLGSRPHWVWFHWPVLQPPPHSKICDCEL